MGWVYVIDKDPGLYLNGFDAEKYLSNIPKLWVTIDADLFHRAYPYEEFVHLSEMNDWQKIVFLGANLDARYGFYYDDEYPTYELPVERVDMIFSDKYFLELTILNGLSFLFSEKYGYPLYTFASGMDYNGDYMFYLKSNYVSYLSDEKNKYQDQLNEFFTILEGKPVKIEIQEVEEYTKN